MTNKLKQKLDDINDRCFVYQVLLSRSEKYNNRLKLVFKIPIIIFSAILGVLNSNTELSSDHSMKIINPVFNILTTLTLSVASQLQFEAKTQDFKSCREKFMKLSSLVEAKMIDDEPIDVIFVNNCQNTYDSIVESLDFDLPEHICKSVRKEWATKKTLPLCINGIPKHPSQRSNSIINEIDLSPLSVIPEKIDGSIVYNHKPRILDVKVVGTENECI